MARLSPAEKIERIRRFTKAWEMLRPHESFFGLTVATFKGEVKASHDTRAEIVQIRKRLQAVIAARDRADKRSERFMRGVKYAVLAHPDEGENGALYGALGFVRAFERRKKKRKAKKKQG